MKKLAVILMVTALILSGATALLAAGLPQALNGVDLATAQPISDAQAQQIRGAAQPTTLPPGFNGTGGLNNGLFTADQNIVPLKGIGIADFKTDIYNGSPSQAANNSRVFRLVF